MSYTYNTWQAALATMMATTTSDPNFLAILPSVIDYAEQRIYRDLDLLATRQRSTVTATAGIRTLTLPASLIVTEGLNVITPANQATPDLGTRNPLTPVTRDYMDMVWASDATANRALPQCFCMLTQTQALLGPCPDANYTVEVIYTAWPTPLSASNQTTILTTMLPDLWMAASMIYATGFQKNFGSQSDDPKMAMSWEMQYQTLLKSAAVVEFRKKFQADSWTSAMPTPVNSKERG